MNHTKDKPDIMILFFFFISLAGWVWEAAIFAASTSFQYSGFDILLYFRGVLHGPWVPIYGVGCVLMLVLKKLCGEHKLTFFVLSMGICALVEYTTSWALETLFHAKWWDYSNKMLDLNGRIYLGGILLFGLGGLLVSYVVEPWFRKKIETLNPNIIMAVSMASTVIFMLDFLFSLLSPNMGMGVSLM